MATGHQSVRFTMKIVRAHMTVAPLIGIGNAGPVEMVCWRDLYTSYGTTDSSILADPIRRVKVRTAPDRNIQMSFEVRTNGPAVHVFALAHVDNCHLHWQMVARSKQDYMFAGTYCSLPPSALVPNGRSCCYHIRCVPLSTDSIEDQARSIMEQDVNDFLAGSVTPATPRIGNLNSIEVVRNEQLAGGGASLRRDLRTGTVDIRVESPSERTREEMDAARTFLDAARATLPVHEGRRPEHLPEEIREAYDALLPLCAALIEQLRHRTWPPYRRASSALPVVRKNFRGVNLDQDDLAAIAALLATGRRRPSPKALTGTILARITGTTATRIRSQLRRKE